MTDMNPTVEASRWSKFAVAFSLLHAQLLSTVAALGSLLASPPTLALVQRNAWISLERDRLLAWWLGLALGLTVVIGLIANKRGLDALERASRLFLPLLPISFLPTLLESEHWLRAPLPFLAILAAFGLLTESCVRETLRYFPAPLSGLKRLTGLVVGRAGWLPLATVIAGSLSYAAYTGYLTVLNHLRFGTGAYDLGIFDNVMFNTLAGHPFRTTIMFGSEAKSFLLGHAPYLAYAFVPFYALHPGAETLLVIQAVLLGSGAALLFAFASTQVSQSYAAALSLLYLLFAPMHAAQFYDFHFLTVATPFLFLLFYALAARRTILTVVATLLLWALREDMAPGIALLGFILLLSGARPKAGLLLGVSSGLWFAVNKFVIMPSFGTWWFANLYEGLTTPTEKGYASVIKTLLINPLFALPGLLSEGKLVYLLHLLVPLALIPIRRPRLSVLLVPGALFTVLTEAGANYSIRYQYSSHYTAYIFAAATLFFAGQRKRKDHGLRSFSALVAIAGCMIIHSTTFGVVIKPSSFIGGAFPIAFSLTDAEKRKLSAFNELKALIPPDATVTATTNDAPHLSNRLDIRAFGHSQFPSEYLLINPASFGMGSTNADIIAALSAEPYGLLKKVDGITLWKKGHQSPGTKSALDRLRRRLDPPRPQRRGPSRR